MGPSDAETLQWLVLKHLIVNVVAFRHDLSDPQIVFSFAAEVGSIRRLEMLVVHAYADLTAVGPGVATDWKLNLIEDLYRRTRRYFDSGDLPGSPDDPEIGRTRERVRESLKTHYSALANESDGLRESSADSDVLLESAQAILDAMPLSLLSRCESKTLTDEIIAVAIHERDGKQGTVCLANFDPAIQATRFVVIRREEQLTTGTFARATAALAANGLSIQRAQIETAGQYAWDYFWVMDPNVSPSDSGVGINKFELEKVCGRLKELIDSQTLPMPKPRRTWTALEQKEPESVNVLPKKVVFDNESVDRCTIISFFAYDQVGLLSRIALAMSKHRLDLSFAKIDTHLDQVADVFYVSEQDGSKLLDQDRQDEIRKSLLDMVDESDS